MVTTGTDTGTGGLRLRAQAAQDLHDVVLAAAEVVVQPDVLTVEDVVGRAVRRARLVDHVLEPRHRPRRVLDRGVAAGRGAGGDRAEHRRAERRGLVRGADLERAPGDVGVDLQHQRALLGQAAAGDDVVDGHAVGLEGLDDHARPVGGRLDQRAVDLLGRGRERRPDQQAADGRVDEDRAVAVPPVERQQPGFAGDLPTGLLLEQLVDVDAAGAGLVVVGARAGTGRRTSRSGRRRTTGRPRSRSGRG